MHKVLRRRCAKIQHSAPFVSVKRAYILNSDANLLTYTLNALLPHIFIYLQLTRSHLSKSLPYHLNALPPHILIYLHLDKLPTL